MRRPILQFCVPCDAFGTLPDGKPALIGVFDRLLRPGQIPQIVFVTRWIDGEGKFSQQLRILKPDLTELLAIPDMPIQLNHRSEPAHTVAHLAGVNFPVPGVYWVEISLDRKPVLNFPLPVLAGPSIPEAIYPEKKPS